MAGAALKGGRMAQCSATRRNAIDTKTAARTRGGSKSQNRRAVMATQLTEKHQGKVVEVSVTGKLAHSDYEKFVPAFERLVKQRQDSRAVRNG